MTNEEVKQFQQDVLNRVPAVTSIEAALLAAIFSMLGEICIRLAPENHLHASTNDGG